MDKSRPREVRRLSECHTAKTLRRTFLCTAQNGKMQVLGNQQLKENYSLISKRVIFKQEAVSPWNFERKIIINKCTRFVLLSQLKECALSALLKLAG